MQLSDHLDDLVRSLGFLSRLPMPARHFRNHDGNLSRAVGMFPLAGLLIGLVPGAVLMVLWALDANAALAVLIALSIALLTTGALHEDGLADCADAFGARGGRADMLSIMTDSRIGAYGVLALLVTFALKATSLTIILSVTGGWNAMLLLAAVSALSRAAMVWHWDDLPPARQDGVAASVGAPEAAAARLALVSGAILFAIPGIAAVGLAPVLIGLGVTAFATWQWTRIARHRLGGHTGDTIGATQQAAETLCLAALALWL